jgi:hypothetical protein
MRLSLRKGARAASSSTAWQEIRFGKWLKCALYGALGFLLGVFFGFGGLFFGLLRVAVIGGRPECGEGPAARDETRPS